MHGEKTGWMAYHSLLHIAEEKKDYLLLFAMTEDNDHELRNSQNLFLHFCQKLPISHCYFCEAGTKNGGRKLAWWHIPRFYRTLKWQMIIWRISFGFPVSLSICTITSCINAEQRGKGAKTLIQDIYPTWNSEFFNTLNGVDLPFSWIIGDDDLCYTLDKRRRHTAGKNIYVEWPY